MPFGKIAENHFVHFHKVDLHVLGLAEVAQEVRQLEIEDFIIAVPPLPGILLLKIIAWNDRPDRRGHDLADIWYILDRYFDYDQDHIMTQHFDVFPEEGEFDTRLISAAVLGRKIKPILAKSEYLQPIVLNIIKQQVTDPSQSKIAKEWAGLNDLSVNYTFSILQKLYNSLL